jgi:hypothetical protein
VGGLFKMTCLTDRQVAQNFVSKGAVTLRWYDPRWAEKIIRPIDVADAALSPLAQIFGNCDTGLRALGLTEAEAAERGLLGRPGGQTEHVNDLWNRLIVNRGVEAP